MKRNKVKNILLIILASGLLGMTIAYATFTSQLIIRDNNIRLKNDTWDIHFENGQPVIPTGGAIVRSEPTLTSTLISGLRADFVAQGDSIEYNFDIKNAGTIDASLSSIVISDPVCESSVLTEATKVCQNLEYSITYADTNEEIRIGDTLDAGEARPVKLYVKYKTGEDIITTSEVIIKVFDVVFNYIQK